MEVAAVLGRAVGAGALAGAVGVAAMTLGEKAEQAITARPDSEVPGRSVLRLAGRSDHRSRRRRVNLPVHVGMAVGVGAVRGVMAFAGLRGPWASAMFTVVRLAADQTVENWAGTGAPPWTWPRGELAIDVLHKAVYAFATGAVADALAGAAGTPPGERHAQVVPGRFGDVGPVPVR
jgi:hypothetical protein